LLCTQEDIHKFITLIQHKLPYSAERVIRNMTMARFPYMEAIGCATVKIITRLAPDGIGIQPFVPAVAPLDQVDLQDRTTQLAHRSWMKEQCSTILIDEIVSLSWWKQEVIAQAMKTPNPTRIA